MKEYLDKSLSFREYLDLAGRLVGEGKTTGPDQSDARIEFTSLNLRRMIRLGKTLFHDAEIERIGFSSNTRPMIWLVITEAWCGDAAQNIPVIEKVAEFSGNIETRYILRDENPELMDLYLTDGARSIPKLVALDAADLSVLGAWGPRPQKASDYFMELRSAGIENAEIMEALQYWYNADKGASLLSELGELIRDWGGENSRAANAS